MDTDISHKNNDWGNFNANVLFLESTGIFGSHSNLKILEVGCGAGRLTDHLAQKGYCIVGFDVNTKLVKDGRVRYPDAELSLASGDCIPFKDSSFDIVLSFDVLEHIPDVKQHLSEVRRVLKSGGQYLFQTPNMLTNLPFEIVKNKSLVEHKKYHCSLQTFWSLKKLLTSYKFRFAFIDVPITNDFVKNKINKVFGTIGIWIVKLIDLDKLPVPLRTNFYVHGQVKD